MFTTTQVLNSGRFVQFPMVPLRVTPHDSSKSQHISRYSLRKVLLHKIIEGPFRYLNLLCRVVLKSIFFERPTNKWHESAGPVLKRRPNDTLEASLLAVSHKFLSQFGMDHCTCRPRLFTTGVPLLLSSLSQ